MANLFAVGLPFSYDGTTNHFATTSGGTATVAAVTSADTVVVDSLSGNATLTVGAAWSCTALTINNANATVACDATHGITASGAVTVTTGALTTNGQTCSWGSFSSSNSNVRTIDITNSTITVTATSLGWDFSNINGLTFTSTGSTLNCTGAAPVVRGQGPTQQPVFHNINYTALNSSSAATATYFQVDTLTIANAAIKTAILNWGEVTVNTSLVCTGNSATNRISFTSGHGTTAGNPTPATITAAAATLSNIDFMDITMSNSTSPGTNFTGTSLGDALGNSGITFDTPAPQTWNGNTTGTWSTAANWTSRVPLPQDNALINGLTSGVVTADMPRLGANVDFTGSSGGTLTRTVGNNVYGSFTMVSGVAASAGQNLVFTGRGTHTLTTGGRALVTNATLSISAPGGTYSLQDNFTTGSSATFNLIFGTFNANGFNVRPTSVSITGTNNRTLNMGLNSIWTVTGTGTVWNIGTVTIQAQTSTIVISDTSATAKTFNGGGATYNNLSITGGGTGLVTITGANTFNSLQVVGGTKSIVWPGSTTTTFTNGGNFGNSTNVITMTASAGSATLAFGTQVNADYLNLTKIIATTTTPAYAGTHSTDGGGNTNWLFSAAPSLGGTLPLMGVG